MKKLLLVLTLIGIIVLTAYGALSGTYTTNGYFYLPGYGAYGLTEFAEYNTYMQIADTQIEANKDAIAGINVRTDEEIEDLAGGLFTGNTETLIEITYQGIDNTVDAVVDENLDHYDNDTSKFIGDYNNLLDDIQFEGATADIYKTHFIITDPTGVSKEITFPDSDQTVGTATTITDGLIVEADLNADEVPANNDILTFDETGDNFSWQSLTELGLLIGTDIQAQNSFLQDLAESAPSQNGQVIVGDGVSGEWDYPTTQVFKASDDMIIMHEVGGLEADVSAYNGLVKITGGATSAITDNSTDWDIAYGWGDHSGEGYLKVITGESIGDLDDVDLTDIANGKILKYNSTSENWECEDESGGGASELSDLSDVGVTTPTDKYVLVADGDSFESRALLEADISDLGTYLEDITGEASTDLTDTSDLTYDAEWNTQGEVETIWGDTLMNDLVDDPAPELGGTLDHNNERDTEVCTVEFNGVYAIGNSGSTETIDWQNGEYQSITIDEACVISFSNEFVGTLNLEVTYGGSFALTFDGGVTLLEEGGVEIVTTDAVGVDLLIFKNFGVADTYVMGGLLDVKD